MTSWSLLTHTHTHTHVPSYVQNQVLKKHYCHRRKACMPSKYLVNVRFNISRPVNHLAPLRCKKHCYKKKLISHLLGVQGFWVLYLVLKSRVKEARREN